MSSLCTKDSTPRNLPIKPRERRGEGRAEKKDRDPSASRCDKEQRRQERQERQERPGKPRTRRRSAASPGPHSAIVNLDLRLSRCCTPDVLLSPLDMMQSPVEWPSPGKSSASSRLAMEIAKSSESESPVRPSSGRTALGSRGGKWAEAPVQWPPGDNMSGSALKIELSKTMSLPDVVDAPGWDEDDCEEDRRIHAEVRDAPCWDGDECCPGQPAAAAGAAVKRATTKLLTLTCTHGPHGITGISLAGLDLDRSNSRTMSSENAVRGKHFSWARGETLGQGSLGRVFKALDQKTGKILAVKEVLIDRSTDADVKFREALENEVNINKELSHPQIVSYLGHDRIDRNLYIYLEYMPGGSVAQVLSQFGAFDESLISLYMRDLLEGLEYLHTRTPPVLHRDVKGANVLVGLDCRVKLSDFGCSKRTDDTLLRSIRGSIPWMAPEVITGSGYGRRSDVWSLGCVAVEMATAKNPWGNFDNPMAAMAKIAMSSASPSLPDNLTQVCVDFVGACVQRDKRSRPCCADLLHHEFVRDVR